VYSFFQLDINCCCSGHLITSLNTVANDLFARHVSIFGGSVINDGVFSAWLVDDIFDYISGFKVSFLCSNVSAIDTCKNTAAVLLIWPDSFSCLFLFSKIDDLKVYSNDASTFPCHSFFPLYALLNSGTRLTSNLFMLFAIKVRCDFIYISYHQYFL
jgi:hypothetical protein